MLNYLRDEVVACVASCIGWALRAAEKAAPIRSRRGGVVDNGVGFEYIRCIRCIYKYVFVWHKPWAASYFVLFYR